MAALKSIIDIVINDDKFKAFAAAFDKYQAKLKSSTVNWAKATKAAAALALANTDTTEHLKQQEEKLKKHKKLYDDIRKATKDIAKDMKEVADTTIRIARSFLRWAGAGGILGGLLGAGGLWGLDRLAASVGDARRSAQGLGVTSGQQQAFGINFGRYVDPNANLSSIAEAKSNYANRWAFGAMGVNQAGKDPAQLAVEMALKAKAIFDRGDQSQQYAQAHGLLQFYTMDELRRLHATSMKDLRASAGDYRKDASGLAVDDAAQKKWQDFAIQMDRANLEIKNVLIDGLTPLITPLKNLSHAVAGALEAFLKSDSLKKLIPWLADEVKKFGDYLSSPKFQTDVQTFIADFGLVSAKIADGLKYLGLIPSSTGTNPDGSPSTDHIQPGDASFKYRNLTIGWAGRSENEASAMGYFMSKGWNKAQAAGIVSNIETESNFNAMAVSPDGKFKGVAQWDDSRRDAMTQWLGKSWALATKSEQYAYLQYELTKGLRKNAGDHLKMINDPYEAGALVSREYEQPTDKVGEAYRRGVLAQKINTIQVNNNTGGNANVQSNQAGAQ